MIKITFGRRIFYFQKKAIKTKFPTATDQQIESFKSSCHKLANIQLLSPTENQEKSDTPYEDWINTSTPNDDYYSKNLIPRDITYEFSNFLNFIDKREKILKEKIADAYPNNFDSIVNRYNLQDKIN